MSFIIIQFKIKGYRLVCS